MPKNRRYKVTPEGQSTLMLCYPCFAAADLRCYAALVARFNFALTPQLKVKY
jgi:hypothetical protein